MILQLTFSGVMGSIIGWLMWEVSQADVNHYCRAQTRWIEDLHRHRIAKVTSILNDRSLLTLQLREQERCLQEALLFTFFLMMIIVLTVIWVNYIINKRFQDRLQNQLVHHVQYLQNQNSINERRRG